MNSRFFAFVVVLMLGAPLAAHAQWDPWAPPDFSVDPDSIQRGECYTMRVPNWANLTLSIGYWTSWTGSDQIENWPSLDSSGEATICTDENTHLGTYSFAGAANQFAGYWWPITGYVTVNSPPTPPQPTSLAFIPGGPGYAGNDCYTMSVGNGANMNVDVQYAVNSTPQDVWTQQLNGVGEWPHCIEHHAWVGTYVFSKIKNDLVPDWVDLAPVSYQVKPAQPTSLAITPNILAPGGSYTLTAGNAGDITLEREYRLNGGPLQTMTNFIPAVSYTNGQPDPTGRATIGADSSTPMGVYSFTRMRNALNTAWVTLPSAMALTVCPSGPPLISSVTPSTATIGSTVSVTITGVNLCAVSLSSAGGLTFSNVIQNNQATSITATVVIASSATPGAKTIQLTAPFGNTTATFVVTTNLTLTKEYIYLGNRIIAVKP